MLRNFKHLLSRMKQTLNSRNLSSSSSAAVDCDGRFEIKDFHAILFLSKVRSPRQNDVRKNLFDRYILRRVDKSSNSTKCNVKQPKTCHRRQCNNVTLSTAANKRLFHVPSAAASNRSPPDSAQFARPERAPRATIIKCKPASVALTSNA